MSKEYLRDNCNRLLGVLENNGKTITLKDERNYLVGIYDIRANRTVDANNRQIGSGNLLTTLL